MKTNSVRILTLGFAGLVVTVILASSVQGRAVNSIEDSDSSPVHIIRKRNAWWSKKSTDEVHRIATAHGNELSDRSLEEVRSSIDCYTDGCVPPFVWCGRRTASETSFLHCKLQHRLCAARCFSQSDMDDVKK